MKFENIDLIDALRRIMDIHTENYKEDFEMDCKLLRELAASDAPADKQLLWMSRPNGTYLLREREVHIEGTFENRTWNFYYEQTTDPILTYAVEITGITDGVVKGNLVEIDYAIHADRLKNLTVTIDKIAVTFDNDSTYYLPFQTYRREIAGMDKEHGNVKSIAYLPESEAELAMILRREQGKRNLRSQSGDIDAHIHELAVQHGKIETLAPLPVAELRKYEAIKRDHPDALVCFAQNGYFELYGEDAKKAAALLGTKLLDKKVHGKPSLPVTGFKESAWAAASKKLWQSGADVFLIKDGETFKELKGADYIPVGATLMVDGLKCRIDAVNFAADEVRLTNITDKSKSIPFTESIAYIRSFVEVAGIAVYDTIPKKPSARDSIRDKLKAAQKTQSTQPPKPNKNKGKDVER